MFYIPLCASRETQSGASLQLSQLSELRMALQTPKLILQYIRIDDIIDFLRFYNPLSEVKRFFYEPESRENTAQWSRGLLQRMTNNVVCYL